MKQRNTEMRGQSQLLSTMLFGQERKDPQDTWTAQKVHAQLSPWLENWRVLESPGSQTSHNSVDPKAGSMPLYGPQFCPKKRKPWRKILWCHGYMYLPSTCTARELESGWLFLGFVLGIQRTDLPPWYWIRTWCTFVAPDVPTFCAHAFCLLWTSLTPKVHCWKVTKSFYIYYSCMQFTARIWYTAGNDWGLSLPRCRVWLQNPPLQFMIHGDSASPPAASYLLSSIAPAFGRDTGCGTYIHPCRKVSGRHLLSSSSQSVRCLTRAVSVIQSKLSACMYMYIRLSAITGRINAQFFAGPTVNLCPGGFLWRNRQF